MRKAQLEFGILKGLSDGVGLRRHFDLFNAIRLVDILTLIA